MRMTAESNALSAWHPMQLLVVADEVHESVLSAVAADIGWLCTI